MAASVTVIPASQIKAQHQAVRERTRVAAYCRVSTEQEEQLGSFENQVDYYNKLIDNNPAWEKAGIFADEGISGTGTKKRKGFQDLIQACDDGKVDLVITKSISRFARNTKDSLQYMRKLKDMGIPIIFEKENINTMEASGELLFTILSSLAQEESRNISENTQWGIRSKFRQGKVMVCASRFMGYDKDSDGNLVINPEQAEVVKRIFREYMEGYQCYEIANRLNKDGVIGATGKSVWASITIERMLENEKYKGDALMQKYYTASFLTKKLAKNEGQLDQYYKENDHEAIIEPAMWDAVQLEMKRRKEFLNTHPNQKAASKSMNPLIGKVFCGKCGAQLNRVTYQTIRQPIYRCFNSVKRNGKTCSNSRVREASLKQAIVMVWNDIVEHKDEHIIRWTRMIEEGDALQKLRAQQMIILVAEGKLTCECPEMTRMIVHEITAYSPTEFKIRLMDGYEKKVNIAS